MGFFYWVITCRGASKLGRAKPHVTFGLTASLSIWHKFYLFTSGFYPSRTYNGQKHRYEIIDN